MSENQHDEMSGIIRRIRDLHPTLERLKEELRANLDCFPDVETVHTDAAYWKTRILFDSVVKLRLFVEHNFHVIETIGVLALTRYIFELAVILKNINADVNFVFLFAQKMKLQEREHFEQYLGQIEAEVALYKSMGASEVAAYNKIAKNLPSSGELTARQRRRVAERVSQEFKHTSDLISQGLQFKFGIYANDAARNGYGIQAKLLEEQVIPQIQDKLRDAEASYQVIQLAWQDKIAAFPKNFREWKWKEFAKKVDMEGEYNFIYSYTSRLLHASPHGLITNQKNLEDSEALMFLRYVEVQMMWILAFAQGKRDRRRHH